MKIVTIIILAINALSLSAFEVGDVVVSTAGIKVRSEPLITAATLLTTHPNPGIHGTVLAVGPTTINGNVETTWYQLDLEVDPDGWVGHNNLQLVEAPEEWTRPYLRLTWKDNSNNEEGFLIESKKGIGNWVEIASVGANITEFVHQALDYDTDYSYRVRAWNYKTPGVIQRTAYTNEAGRRTPSAIVDEPMPEQPTILELSVPPDTITNVTLPAGARIMISTSP